MKKRLEFQSGQSSKFWQIQVAGKAYEVTFGRIGTAGRSTTKQFDSTSAARNSAKKLITEKLTKGYTDTSDQNTKTKTKGIAGATETLPSVVIETMTDCYTLIYQDREDLWFYLLDESEFNHLNRGLKLAEYESEVELLKQNQTERWSFANSSAAKKALSALAAKANRSPHCKLIKKLRFDAARNLANPGIRLTESRDRIGQFEFAAKGNVDLHLNKNQWLHARPPSRCLMCGGFMLPLTTIAGPIDSRFGKSCCVAIASCANNFPCSIECDGTIEVAFQSWETPCDSWYLKQAHRREFYNLFPVRQWNMQGKPMFGWLEHRGEKDVPGELIQHSSKDKKQANNQLKRRLNSLQNKHGYELAKKSRLNKRLQAQINEIAAVRRRYVGEPPRIPTPNSKSLSRTIEPYTRHYHKKNVFGGIDSEINSSPIGGEPSSWQGDAHRIDDSIFIASLTPENGNMDTDVQEDGCFSVFLNTKTFEPKLVCEFD